MVKSEFSAVIFNNVPECYPPDREIECRYKIKSSVKPNSRDWIGLFKVGWQTSREHCTYEWSPLPNIQNGEQERPVANRVIFLQRYLPKADDEFYQFCYVTYAGDVRGMSVPFQIKNKPIQQEELECCEIEDDEGSSIMVVKNKTAILEESLGRALKENAVLKASKKTVLADLQNAHEAVMQLEVGKADLTAAWKESENKLSCVEQLLAQRNLLEEEQSKRRDLESINNDLKTMQENLNRRVGELMMILEQERAQTLQVEKNKEKLVIERKQYLENMTADHQIIEKLQNDLKGKEDEFSTVKGRLVELKTRARSESAEFAEKMENVNSANGRLQEQLVQITEENSLLKRNMEEESERLTKKVRDTYLELKSKDEELERAREEIANYRCKIEEVEIAKQEILNDASHQAELLGSTIDKLQADLKEKQEHINQLEDVNTQLTQEKGKTTALEEDYESVISVLHDQLEGEKALNQSLCTQSDRNVASLQGQVQKQLNANMELSQQLEGKNAEIRGSAMNWTLARDNSNVLKRNYKWL
ncbi:apoptotic process [Desmophyllum pertusum]|uniref:Apoptotic process n=1 Tax=Desmophyllum pertusum TaxID=174260 RepID=A0A9W9YR01_9CNID|nr:apoptotic process [Desmophyllum pertusum]